MTISDAFTWLDQHPTAAGVLFVVALWLLISLLSLLENPTPGSKLALVVDGVKRWGIDLPGTARWLKALLTHVRDARTGALLDQASAAPRLADVVTLPVSRPSEEPVTLDLTRDVPPALQPAVSPPANSNPDPPEAA